MRIIIAGSTSFDDFKLMCEKCDEILKDLNVADLELVCGEALGADRLGEQYALLRNFKTITYFPAEWKKYGKKAGMGPSKSRYLRSIYSTVVCM
jgi:hypothetical protein